MLGFSGVRQGLPTKGVIEDQVADPFKSWVDGEVLTEDTFDDFHNYILGTSVFENPDPLIRERGFRILDKMIDTDPSIKSAYWARVFTILSEKYRVDPACEGCRRSEEIANFVKWNFDVFMRRSLHSFLRMMLDATRQGFKIAELIWKVIEDGPYRGMIGLYDLKVRDSRNYSFLVDETGALDPMGVIEGVSSTGFHTTSGTVRRLPSNKFVIYIYNALNDDGSSLYGTSDFRAAWRPFYGDTTSHRLELRSGETFARPPLYGQVAHGEYTKPEQEKIQKDLAGAYNRTYTQIPEGVTIKELGVERSDTRAFESLRDRHRAQAKQSMMTPGREGSNQAAAEVDARMFLTVLDGMAIDLAENVMERQVIERLVNMNYKTSKRPRFIVPRLSFDRNKRAEFISKSVEKGVIAPDEPWIRPFLDIPRQDLDSRDRQMGVKQGDALFEEFDQGDINRSVKAIIRNGRGDVLVLKDSGTDFFDFPGGHMQEGESMEAALKREVMEEAGIDIDIERQLGRTRLVLGDQKRTVDFFSAMVSGDDEVRLSDEHEGFVWANTDRIRQLNMGAFSRVLDQVLGHVPDQINLDHRPGHGSKKKYLATDGMVLGAGRGDVIRQLKGRIEVRPSHELDDGRMFILREKDTGRISIVGRLKKSAPMSKVEDKLKKLVDSEPQNRFFLARGMGATGEGDKTETVLKVVRTVVAEPKDRVVMVGVA
jgi:8-oxo-dGTP pyrophosphatase MutT (NUDIX family)